MKHLILFLTCSFTCFASVIPERCELTIATPSLQSRCTRKLRLDNGLEALLISDPGTPQSGAALAVNVGSWDDPIGRAGMAHFVEHLLFLGTEKYPEEGAYLRFLNEHAGQRNAFTMSDRTVYFFSVNQQGFDEALDRFGHFFIDPLFNPSGVERECLAIHQEYCKNIPSDLWRLHYVQKAVCHPDHPFHRFCIGNQQTLAKISQEELKTWYQTHYGAQLMHLVVLSDKSLDAIEEQVISIFSQVKQSAFVPHALHSDLLSQQAKGSFVYVVPIQQIQTLELTWEIPTQDLEVGADRLVCHVLGHEGEGSLLAYLKQEGLAYQLKTASVEVGKKQKLLTLSIQLTDQGLKEYEKVIGICFEALAKYRLSGLPASIFDELKETQLLQYTYQSRSSIADFVSNYATAMVDEPLETFPQKTLVLTRYEGEKVDKMLASLTPETCLFALMAPLDKVRFKPSEHEPWLGADYTLSALPDKKLKYWALSVPHPSICLPAANSYLPHEFSLVQAQEESQEPLVLVDSTSGVCYLQSDQEYKIPQISWSFMIQTPAIAESNPKTQVLADLYCHTVEQRLSHKSYLAYLAGLDFELEPKANGIQLTISGFHDKATLLLQDVLQVLTSTTPTKEEFEKYCLLANRAYCNQYTKSPIAEANELLWSILYKDYCGSSLKEKILKSLTYEDMKKFSKSLFNQTYTKAMLYGNINSSQAQDVWDHVMRFCHHSNYPMIEHPKKAVATLDAVHLLNHKTPLPGNALILAADLGEFSFQRRAAMDILCKGLEEPFFHELRTQQQTAYYVRHWGEEIERHLYAFFATQSSSHDTRDLLSRFELFLESNLRSLQTETLPKERFEIIRSALIERLSHPVENLAMKGSLLTRLAFDYDGDFKWLDKRILALKELSYEEFIQFAHEFFGSNAPKRLAICVNGELPAESGVHYQTLNSVDKLRKRFAYKGKL